MSTIPPIVSDIDRKWALEKCPPWMRSESAAAQDCCGEIEDRGEWLDGDLRTSKSEVPSWDDFVAEQIERFEKFYAGEYKTRAEWSSLWRKGWWPKTNPERRYPKSAPKTKIPFFRAGTPEFARALKVATDNERSMWMRHKVAHFMPDDSRLSQVRGGDE